MTVEQQILSEDEKKHDAVERALAELAPLVQAGLIVGVVMVVDAGPATMLRQLGRVASFGMVGALDVAKHQIEADIIAGACDEPPPPDDKLNAMIDRSQGRPS